ncbi:MAG: phosphoglycerate dehydrogenase [Verrucomicrobiota bacterium]
MKILLTTTSFQDTPGPHHELLESKGYEIHRERGPLSEEKMLELAGDYDAFLCGDDAITRSVLEKSLPKIKLISKYGIGLDKVDVDAATDLKVPVTFCPGVNHTTVAEHTFGLLFAVYRKIVTEANYVSEGRWKRMTGHEVMGKTMGLVGLGRIGREVAIRAKAFGMKVLGFGAYWPEEFTQKQGIEKMGSIDELIKRSDILSIHTKLTEETRGMINSNRLKLFKDGSVVLNCARGEIVETSAMVEALNSGKLLGYGADVLDAEPPPTDHPLLKVENAVITPHIGSRTMESVERQATMAVKNLIAVLEGREPLAQANSF